MAEPVLVSIAAALAGKSVMSLYDFVKRKFADRREAAAALAAAEQAGPDSAEVRTLADQLAAAEAADPEFGTELRRRWDEVSVQTADRGGVVNQISGNVSGKVVQARDIQGGVSL